MKINEVEKILEIPKASIRFYEKEGLLIPKRGDNKYRDYSEEDLERLKKIIVFRKIGLSVEDVKRVLFDDLSLQDALTQNIEKLNEQKREIEGAIKVCVVMRQKNESDENGKLKFSPIVSVLIVLFTCFAGGLVWFFLDGMDLTAFAEGCLLPFVTIVIVSIFGLPLHFLKKKHPRAAEIIRKIGYGICVVSTIALLALAILTWLYNL